MHPEEALTGYGSTTHQGLSIFCHVLAIHQSTFSFASEIKGKSFSKHLPSHSALLTCAIDNEFNGQTESLLKAMAVLLSAPQCHY